MEKSFSYIFETPNCIRSQFLWSNNKPCHFKEFSGKKCYFYKSTVQRQSGFKTLERFYKRILP